MDTTDNITPIRASTSPKRPEQAKAAEILESVNVRVDQVRDTLQLLAEHVSERDDELNSALNIMARECAAIFQEIGQVAESLSPANRPNAG